MAMTILFLFLQNVTMADTFRSEGKIYVVIVVFLLILFSLFYYMFRIDKKIDKIEKNR
jgi:hypothetical protein|tara:strand:+ start:67054 stop:67227 length:174 start_codon:yes stop_codon:yes gene_type:complete